MSNCVDGFCPIEPQKPIEFTVSSLVRSADAKTEEVKKMKASTDLKTKKKIRFIDLVKPRIPLPADIQFEVYRWLFESANSDRYITYGWGSDALSLLVGKPTCLNIDNLDGEEIGRTKHWRDDLNWRFRNVLLEDCVRSGAALWRADHRLAIDQSRVLPLRWRWDMAAGREVDVCLGHARGRRLLVPPNSAHPEAVVVQRGLISLTRLKHGVAYEYKLMYGYSLDDSSAWSLAYQGEVEQPFCEFVVGAEEWLERNTTYSTEGNGLQNRVDFK